MFYLICAWRNGWVNNREAGDLRRHHAHYDITAMCHHANFVVVGGNLRLCLCHIQPRALVQFLTPVRFLARKTEWRARKNFTQVLFTWSHHATGPVLVGTDTHLNFVKNKSQSSTRAHHGHRTGPTRDPSLCSILHGSRTRSTRVPCETHKGAVRQSYVYTSCLVKAINWKSRTGVVCGQAGPVGARKAPLRSTHGLFTAIYNL